MKIYAKASLDIAEIKEKIRCGCDGIEYNLTDDFLTLGGDFLNNYPKDIFHMHDVTVVHTPYDKAKQMMNMERVFQHEDLSMIENVFKLAQYLAEYWKHRELLVIHSSISMVDFMEFEIYRKRLETVLAEYFAKYPDVDMAIENVIPLEYKPGEFSHPRLYNGVYMDTPLMAGYLRERFGERVGTVLDTCHAMMTEKYLGAIMQQAEFDFEINVEQYFKQNQGMCKLIHFNDFVGNGFRQNHGTSFTDKNKVKQLLDFYYAYGYDCPLTLEIREDDYTDCVNYRRTKKLIEEC